MLPPSIPPGRSPCSSRCRVLSTGPPVSRSCFTEQEWGRADWRAFTGQEVCRRSETAINKGVRRGNSCPLSHTRPASRRSGGWVGRGNREATRPFPVDRWGAERAGPGRASGETHASAPMRPSGSEIAANARTAPGHLHQRTLVNVILNGVTQAPRSQPPPVWTFLTSGAYA